VVLEELRQKQISEASARLLEAETRLAAARARRAASFARWKGWFDRVILQFGWYQALPEMVQPMVIGLAIALPFVLVLAFYFL
jgi:hypothetical protein